MRNSGFRVLFFALFSLLALPPARAADLDAQLATAKAALTGQQKDTATARPLLLEIVERGKHEGSPNTLLWAHIYLGYIDDRAGNRQSAVEHYKNALKVKGAFDYYVAKYGLEHPLVWIRNLDGDTAPPRGNTEGVAANAEKQGSPSKLGKAYVTKQPPADLKPATGLSSQQRRENFEALWTLIDQNYAHFKLKNIDWDEVGRRYRARLDALTGDDDFYRLMAQFVSELKDTHSWLHNYREPPLLNGVPELPVDMFQGKPFVVQGPKAGWEVLAVDGMPVGERLEWLRPYLRGFSSERAFRRQAGRWLLGGTADRTSVTLRSPDGTTETLSFRRVGRLGGPQPRPVALTLTNQHFVHFGRLPSGVGYIRIESFNGREEITKEFDRALHELRDTPALVLDIRDNPGGFGQPEIVARLLRAPAYVGSTFVKSGPRHDDLERHRITLQPSGKPYTRPVALLVNDVTGSAADLFAMELRSAGRVITLGTTTHGNLSGTAIYAVLPCGLIVRISNGYMMDANGRPIEVNGNLPDITVEPDIQDYLHGRDPVLERAVEVLTKNVSGS